MSETPECCVIVDGHAVIYRAYHAFPELSTHEGLLVNAVYGFSRILLTAIRDFTPTYIAVAFDHPTPTFRHTDFVDYKAHRAEMPDDLKPQIQIIKEVVDALNIPRFELPGYEADDLIGTLAARVRTLHTTTHPQLSTIVVTGDRDTFQLVDEVTHVWLPGRAKGQRDQEYDAEAVKAAFGVCPEQVVDLKALMGDASDNIPGVAGIGKKTATALIQTFGSLDGVYEAVEQPPTGSLLKGAVLRKLQEGKEQAYLSQKLATIDCAVPIDFDLECCRVTSYDRSKIGALFESYEFHSLKPLLPPDEFQLSVQEALF